MYNYLRDKGEYQMKLYGLKGIMSVFYYLMAIDKSVSSDELEKFCEIGNELDSEMFFKYKDSLIEECEKNIKKASETDEYCDIIFECVDNELLNNEVDKKGIPSRLLIWNMLVIAFSNNEYAQSERRLIKHVSRVTKVEESVFLEMEELLKTSVSVMKESNWIKKSNLTYSEVAPVVEELEKRMNVILNSAKQLIADESLKPSIDILEIKPDLIDNLKSMTGNIVEDLKGDAKDIRDEIAIPLANVIKKQSGKLFDKFKSKKKTSECDTNKDDKVTNNEESIQTSKEEE